MSSPNGQTESIEGEWLILADRNGVGENLAALIREMGARCVLVSTADCDSTSVDVMRMIVAQASPQRIVHLWSLDSTASNETTLDSLQRDQEVICASALHLVQAVSSEPISATERLYFVTRGSVALHDGEAVAYSQAPLWGLARAMSVEHPKLWGGIFDLDLESTANEAARQLFKSLREPDGEDMVAFRAGQRYVARMQKDESMVNVAVPLQIEKRATYLIVGGLGGLGLATARWLSKLGARNLALVSRSGPGAEATRAIQAMEESGTCIRVFQADVSIEEDMALAMASIKSTMPPLKGVLHLAGVLDDAMLSDQNWERFHAAGLAKVEGAWVLHKLTEEDELDFFVLFSSMAALVTMPGQGNYAAANCFLDALANYRRSIGLTALSVNWGPWGEIGHAATDYGRNAHLQLAQLGIDAISPRQGLELLETLLSQQQTQVCIAQVNWNKLFQNHPAAAVSPLLREQVQHAELPVETIEDTEFVKGLRALQEDERREALSYFLSDLIAGALKLNDGERLVPQQGLFALGLDSILALQLKSQLEITLGRSFRATLFFTHPNIASLSDHLLSELDLGGNPGAPKTAVSEFQETGTESIDQTMPFEKLSEEEIANLIVREIGYGKEIPAAGSRRMEEPAGG